MNICSGLNHNFLDDTVLDKCLQYHLRILQTQLAISHNPSRSRLLLANSKSGEKAFSITAFISTLIQILKSAPFS